MKNSDFYNKSIDANLRFGDVLQGYLCVNPSIKSPFSKINSLSYKINVDFPDFVVLLSPCCSIGGKKILLSPLIPIRKEFIKIDYFKEDLTRLNRRMKHRDVFTEEQWNKKDDTEKVKILNGELVYTNMELFVYESNEIFPFYEIKGYSINNYMIDFRSIYKIDCDEVISPDKSPVYSKRLQLTIDSREELRQKISFYFSRVPDEDKIYLSN